MTLVALGRRRRRIAHAAPPSQGAPAASSAPAVARIVSEHVLDASVVDLQADQTEAQVARRVADQVAHLEGGVGGIHRQHRAADGRGDPRADQRAGHPGLRIDAQHLHEQGARRVEELVGARGAQQPPPVEDDDVVADPLELTEQVRRDDDGDAEVVADALDEPEHLLAGRGVQAVRRLVEQHQSRGRGPGPAPASPSASCRWSSRPSGGSAPPQPDVAQHLGGPLPRGDAGEPGHHRQVHDEVAGADVGGQAVVLGR